MYTAWAGNEKWPQLNNSQASDEALQQAASISNQLFTETL